MSVIGRPLLINAFGGTKSGDIVNFGSSLKVGIEPVQDLHGYDNPWPAGGGKNIVNKDTDIVGAIITSTGGINLVSYTEISITEWIPVEPNTTYTHSGCGNVNSYASKRGAEYESADTSTFVKSIDGQIENGTFTTGANTHYVRLNVLAAYSDTAMLEKGSYATAYAPYSNICPISGWTECNVYSTGAIHHYGAVWDTVNASMTRTGDAANITTNTANFKHSGSVNANYSNPFDSIYPWSGRKLCNISLTDYMALQSGDSITDCVTYWEGEAGFSYTDADGVWVYTPDFYGISYWKDGKRYFDVCDTPLSGYRHYPAQISARWRGTAESRTIGGTSKIILLSKPGLPITNTFLSTIHTYAKNGGMTLDSVYTLDASLLLYLVEYANYNAQSAIGNGVSDLYDQTTLHPDAAVTAGTTVQFTGLTSAQLEDFIVGAIVDFGTASGGAQTAKTYITAVETASGVTTVTLADAVTITTDTFVSIHGRINYTDADIGSMSGYIGTNGKSDAYYRGEALWGNMFFYTLGAYKSDTEHVWLAEEGTEDNYDAINTAVHTDTGIVLASANNYIKKLAWPDSLGTLFACALCTEVPGTSAAPVGDYFATSAGNNRVLLVGGNANNGTNAGPFYWNWANAAGNWIWFCSGRPLLKTPVQGGI